MIPTWAVIPSDGRDCLRDCLISIRDQVEDVIVVLNGDRTINDIAYLLGYPHHPPMMIRDTAGEPNISRWWNLGLRTAEEMAARHNLRCWNVLVLNDDVVCPPQLVEFLSVALRDTSAVLAYPDQYGGQELVLHGEARAVDLTQRITGYAWMIRGEEEIHLDEGLVWWYGDDDLDWRCRQRGGSLLVPGCAVQHESPNGWQAKHPELIAQTQLDRQYFFEKWQRLPH